MSEAAIQVPEVPDNEAKMMADLIKLSEQDGVDPVARAMAMFMTANTFLRERDIMMMLQTN